MQSVIVAKNHRYLLEEIAYESKQIRQIEDLQYISKRDNFSITYIDVRRLLKGQEPIF